MVYDDEEYDENEDFSDQDFDEEYHERMRFQQNHWNPLYSHVDFVDDARVIFDDIRNVVMS